MDALTNSCGIRSFSCTPGTEPAEADPAPSLPGTPGGPDAPGGGPRQTGGDNAAPHPAPCQDGAEILREIDALRAVLAGRAGGLYSPAPGDRLIVVARFFSDLTPEAWNALARYDGPGEPGGTNEHKGHGPWFALELDPEEYPQMVGLCRADAPPLGPVCPLTAALLPEPFLSRVAAEVASLSASGGEATLAIFSVDGASAGTAPAAGGLQAVPTDAAQTHTDRTNGNQAGEAPPRIERSLRALARIMRRHARACDIPGRPTPDHLALLMPGVGPFRARAMTERIIASFQQETAPAGAVRAGLASYDSDAPVSADILLARAEAALTLAQPGFSHTFRKAGMPEPERRTQVQACEKAFLFFGDSERV